MAETIFMIHGMFCGKWVWENYTGFFEQKGYRCLNVDLRFHDAPPRVFPDPRLGTTGVPDYLADLEETIRSLDRPPILMGHSLGALLAQILASRGLSRALVLLTPAAPAGIFALKPSVIRTLGGLLFRWGFWKKPVRLSFAAAAYAVFNRLPATECQQAYQRLVYESGRAAAQTGLWFLDPDRATRVDETRVTCPVLVIAGGQDKITPVPVVRRVAEKYRAVSTFKVFADHSHWLFAEPGWQEPAAFICDWLQH